MSQDPENTARDSKADIAIEIIRMFMPNYYDDESNGYKEPRDLEPDEKKLKKAAIDYLIGHLKK